MTATWQDLVRRLALAYDGGEPVWPSMGAMGETQDGAELMELYREAVEQVGTVTSGVWKECPCCGRWYVDNVTRSD